jgi:hypothetical protein
MVFPSNLVPYSPRSLQILARSTIQCALEVLVTERVHGIQLSCEGPVLALDPEGVNLLDLLVGARLADSGVWGHLGPFADELPVEQVEAAVARATREALQDFPQLRVLRPGLPGHSYRVTRKKLELEGGAVPALGEAIGLFGIEVSRADGDERATQEYLEKGAYTVVHDRVLGLGVGEFEIRLRIACLTPDRLRMIQNLKRDMLHRVSEYSRCLYQKALESLATSAQIEYGNTGVFLDSKRLHLAYLGGVTSQRLAAFRRRVHDRLQYSPERHLFVVGVDRAGTRSGAAAQLSDTGLCMMGWAMERLGARAVVLGFENSFVTHERQGPILVHRTHRYKSAEESFDDPAVASRAFAIPQRPGCVSVPHLDFDSLWRCAQHEFEDGDYDLVDVFYWPSSVRRGWPTSARPRDDSVGAAKRAAAAARTWERPKVKASFFGLDGGDDDEN